MVGCGLTQPLEREKAPTCLSVKDKGYLNQGFFGGCYRDRIRLLKARGN